MNWSDALQQAAIDLREESGYGRADCCQLARRYWLLMTGNDVGQWLAYATKAEADALIAGGGGLRELLEDLIGPPHDEPRTEPGDVVIVRVQDEEAVGICGRQQVTVLHPDRGLVRCSVGAIVESWACPVR